MKIKLRDGTVAEVPDSYVLADGESMTIPVSFMDARRGMIHDGRGNPAGQRFLVRDNAAEDQAVEAAYRENAKSISERWRQGPGQRSSPARSEPPQTFDNPEAARAAAYAEYSRTIQERWRRCSRLPIPAAKRAGEDRGPVGEYRRDHANRS